jgi:hypothetical protein
MSDDSPLSDDILRGVPAISKFVGDDDERRTYYRLEKGYIPAGKEGSTWVASKSRLRQHYADLTRGAF